MHPLPVSAHSLPRSARPCFLSDASTRAARRPAGKEKAVGQKKKHDALVEGVSRRYHGDARQGKRLDGPKLTGCDGPYMDHTMCPENMDCVNQRAGLAGPVPHLVAARRHVLRELVAAYACVFWTATATATAKQICTVRPAKVVALFCCLCTRKNIFWGGLFGSSRAVFCPRSSAHPYVSLPWCPTSIPLIAENTTTRIC